MALVQFACPHCTGQFTLENPPPGETIECPHCSRPVAIPAGAPPPADESIIQRHVSPVDRSAAAGDFAPLEFLGDERGGGRGRAPLAERRPRANARPTDRAARRRRQQRRSLVVMILCLVVLAIAVVVLGRF